MYNIYDNVPISIIPEFNSIVVNFWNSISELFNYDHFNLLIGCAVEQYDPDDDPILGFQIEQYTIAQKIKALKPFIEDDDIALSCVAKFYCNLYIYNATYNDTYYTIFKPQ
jgi:hypothetical protein